MMAGPSVFGAVCFTTFNLMAAPLKLISGVGEADIDPWVMGSATLQQKENY
jgi:hypothetical protein